MFKLFVTVLAMSDVGTAVPTVAITDYPDQASCYATASQMGQPTGIPGKFSMTVTKSMNGHTVTVQMGAHCLPVEPVYVDRQEPGDIPPPIAGALAGFLEGLQQRRR